MNAQTLTRALNGRWYGSYGLAYCPAHDNQNTPALSLRDGEGERLLAHCHAGCDFRNIIRALRDRGLCGTVDSPLLQRPRADNRSQKRCAEDRRRGIHRAQSVWTECAPVAGTLAERYLRRRSIHLPLPASLRFHRSCWHPTATRLPALVAGISEVGSSELVAVHRTYLQEPGEKWDREPTKAMLGPAAGCGVEVSKGSGPLIVAEGIETALSLAEGLFQHKPHTIAALSTSGVAGLRLPERVHELILAPDGDAAGEKAAEALAKRAAKLGWRVRILPAPSPGLDWNDAARGRHAHERAS